MWIRQSNLSNAQRMLEVQINYRCQEVQKEAMGLNHRCSKDRYTVGGADTAKHNRATMILQMTLLDLMSDPKIRQWESSGISTRNGPAKSNGWKVHGWDLIAPMLCLQRLATPGWWQMATGWHLRTNGGWQLSTSCAQVQWRTARHKPIELTKLTDWTLPG